MPAAPNVRIHGPHFIPPADADRGVGREQLTAASREAAAREAAYLAALNRAQPLSTPQVVLRAPKLTANFGQTVAAVDAKIYRRGVAVAKDKLVALGRERFQQLLALDLEARKEQ